MTASGRAPDWTLSDLLRRPQPEVRALQDRLLARMVERCYGSHPFYGKLMRRERLEPRHVRTCDELVRLPPTTKQDFLGDPDAFRLDGEGLPLEERTLWKMIYTTGTTTGNPAPLYVTSFDHYLYMFSCTRRDGLVDLRDTDLVANLFPLTPFPMGAYARATDEAAACGAGMVFAHPGRPDPMFPLHRSLDDAVRLVERHRATVLWGVAGFVRRVLVGAEESGADFGAVRMTMITGEASSPAMREDMRRRMRRLGCADSILVNRYGSTEQGAGMVECREGSGFHSLAPDQVFHEVVDASSGRRLAEGATGMLAFTHLLRSGTVFLRYLVGDVVSVTSETCRDCGRTSPRISSQPVRSGDIVKIKGTLVNLQALKECLERMPEVQEYQIVVRPRDANDPFSGDELVIRLAAAQEAQARAAGIVAREAARVVHLRPCIEFVRPDDIFDPLTAAKPRRVLDLRD